MPGALWRGDAHLQWPAISPVSRVHGNQPERGDTLSASPLETDLRARKRCQLATNWSELTAACKTARRVQGTHMDTALHQQRLPQGCETSLPQGLKNTRGAYKLWLK